MRLGTDSLLDEFKTNQEHFNEIYQYKQEMKEKWDKFLSIISNPKTNIKDRTLKRPNNVSIEFNTSNIVVNSILNSGNLDIISNDSLKYYISSWNNNLKAYREVESRHVNLVENSLRQYEVKNRVINDHNGLEFHFDNPFYKNYTMEAKVFVECSNCWIGKGPLKLRNY